MIARRVSLAGVASLVFLAACSYVRLPVSNPLARTLAVGSTQARVAADSIKPLASAVAVGALQAPICQASQTCAALNAEQIPISCVKKVPYTNVLVPVGTTFEVLDPSGDFMCLDTGVVTNGKEVLTCHGKELYSFQLRLTNASCSAAALTSGSGQCDDGYGYDAAQKCCAPIAIGAAGSTVVTVSLGACPVPNP